MEAIIPFPAMLWLEETGSKSRNSEVKKWKQHSKDTRKQTAILSFPSHFKINGKQRRKQISKHSSSFSKKDSLPLSSVWTRRVTRETRRHPICIAPVLVVLWRLRMSITSSLDNLRHTGESWNPWIFPVFVILNCWNLLFRGSRHDGTGQTYFLFTMSFLWCTGLDMIVSAATFHPKGSSLRKWQDLMMPSESAVDGASAGFIPSPTDGKGSKKLLEICTNSRAPSAVWQSLLKKELDS